MGYRITSDDLDGFGWLERFSHCGGLLFGESFGFDVFIGSNHLIDNKGFCVCDFAWLKWQGLRELHRDTANERAGLIDAADATVSNEVFQVE